MRLRFLFSFLLLAACGGSADLSSSSPEGADPKQPSDGKSGGARGNEEPSANLPTHEVKVTLHNGTSGEVRLVRDYQAPLWLEIGEPAYQLNGYGQSWCGNKDAGHNEPFFLVEKIAAGASFTARWSGQFVTFDADGSCWKYVSAPNGSVPARACIYEGKDDPGRLASLSGGATFPAGPGAKGAPSTWFEKPPTRCIPLTIEIKAGGSAIDVVIAAP